MWRPYARSSFKRAEAMMAIRDRLRAVALWVLGVRIREFEEDGVYVIEVTYPRWWPERWTQLG